MREFEWGVYFMRCVKSRNTYSKNLYASILFSIAVCLLVTPNYTLGQTRSFTEDGVTFHRTYIPHPVKWYGQVELYWTRPAGEARYPAIIFVHGHQWPKRPGGKVYVENGRLAHTVEKGYVAAAVSQSGYGKSGGERDFCGPNTQQAVLAAIRFLRKQPFVNPDKVGLMGRSRGAIVASMVATQDTQLAAVALAAGMYDVKSGYPTGIRAFDRNIRREAGTSDEAFKARSALHHADRIKAPILLLHGEGDNRISSEQAKLFANKLKSLGVPVVLQIFYWHGHRLPYGEVYDSWVYPFFHKYLKAN